VYVYLRYSPSLLLTPCRYDFYDFGNGAPQTFTTDTIECEGTSKPVLDYEFVHSIDKVTQDFIDFLCAPLEVRLYVSPDVVAPKDLVGTTNEAVKNNITNGVTASGRGAAAGGGGGGGDAALQAELAQLRMQQEHLAAENKELKGQVKTLRLQKKLAFAGTAAARQHFAGDDKSQACSVQ
jgi:hypothetical protein